ncbi:MAG: tartrate dehydrogenase [Actinobacteria bacterium]|nr:tartrate dehydrogenase [Actinomycetota bacterium]
MSEVVKSDLRIALIPGDGVGTEVAAVGQAVVEAVAAATGSFTVEWTEFPWGCDFYERTGRMMDADGVERLRSFDAIYFGAVGWPTVPDHTSLWGLRLEICQGMDLWANVRPVEFLPCVRRNFGDESLVGHSWILVRENSEGEYSGVGGRNFAARPGAGQVAVESAMFTEVGCERIIRFAFELALERPVKRLIGVTKSNAQRYGMVLWDEIFERVSAEYPTVETESCLVDAMAAKMVLDPESLSVIVSSNLHGDVLSDLGSALAGSLGLGYSANLDPSMAAPSMFEPIHGSAPDIAGRGIANPFGAICSAGLMLRHLGHEREARMIEEAVVATAAASCLTPDLGGRATTAEVQDAMLQTLAGAGASRPA